MKKFILFVLTVGLFHVSIAQEKMLVAGSGWKNIALIDKKTGTIEWSHALQSGEDCNDIEMISNGDVLIAAKTTARLINKDQKVIWSYDVVEDKEEVNTATELPSGEFMLAICGNPSRIVTLNSQGKQISEIKFESGIANVHGQLRQVLPTQQGTYIIPLMEKGEVVELTKSGKIINRVTVGGNPFSVKIMKSGDWLVSCGDGHKLAIVNPKKGIVVRNIRSEDIAGADLLFVAETEILKKGNLIITNWNGHSKDKTQPKIIEIDNRNNIVWSLPANEQITNISALHTVKKW